MRKRSGIIRAAVLSVALSAVAASVRDGFVEAELIADVRSVKPGDSFWLGVRLRMDEGWHTYWRNPGDTGLETTIAWLLPEDVKAGPILWPVPEKIPAPPSYSYGYHGDVILLARATVSPSASTNWPLPLAARVKWLMCNERCIAGSADVNLALPVGQSTVPDTAAAEVFANAIGRLPQTLGVPETTAQGAGREITLALRGFRPEGRTIRMAYFYPDFMEVLDHAERQVLVEDEKEPALKLIVSPYSRAPPDRLSGVLSVYDGENVRAYQLSVPVTWAK